MNHPGWRGSSGSSDMAMTSRAATSARFWHRQVTCVPDGVLQPGTRAGRADLVDRVCAGTTDAVEAYPHGVDAGRLRADEAVVLDEVARGVDAEVGGEETADGQAGGLERDERDGRHVAVGVEAGQAGRAGPPAHGCAEVRDEPAPLLVGKTGEVFIGEDGVGFGEQLDGQAQLLGDAFGAGGLVAAYREDAPHARGVPVLVVVQSEHGVAGGRVDEPVGPQPLGVAAGIRGVEGGQDQPRPWGLPVVDRLDQTFDGVVERGDVEPGKVLPGEVDLPRGGLDLGYAAEAVGALVLRGVPVPIAPTPSSARSIRSGPVGMGHAARSVVQVTGQKRRWRWMTRRRVRTRAVCLNTSPAASAAA